MIKNTDSGISPVIGVVLIVALTVSIVALFGSIYFDVADQFVNVSPDTSVELNHNESNNVVEANVLRNTNVDYFIFKPPEDSIYSGSSKTIGSPGGEVGEIGSAQYNATDLSSNQGIYTLIAVMPDGERVVIDTINVE